MSAHNWRQIVRYWGLRHIRRLFGDHIAELVRKERKTTKRQVSQVSKPYPETGR